MTNVIDIKGKQGLTKVEHTLGAWHSPKLLLLCYDGSMTIEARFHYQANSTQTVQQKAGERCDGRSRRHDSMGTQSMSRLYADLGTKFRWRVALHRHGGRATAYSESMPSVRNRNFAQQPGSRIEILNIGGSQDGCDGKPDRCRNRVQVSLPHSFAVPVMEQQNFQRL
jgi:hypothetical protein